MDWLRRNWPDLAIGIALVAVIAGIIATLLTGGSFFPLTPTQPAVTPTPPAVTEPAPPVAPEAPPEAAPGVAPEVEAAPDVPSPEPLQPGVAVLAPDGSPADEPAPAEEPVTEPPPPPPSDEVAEAPPEPVTPTPSEPAAPTPPPSEPTPAAPSAALPSAAADPEAPFRVSVGAFRSPENAERQADTFRSAGYPVFTGTQGDLTIVLVGPYQDEADAAAVAARIRAGDFGIEPVVYRYQPDATSAASSAPAPSAPAEPPPAAAPPATPTPTPAATPTAAPSATAGRYLQVGAFASAQSARPLRAQLESLGFAASEVVEDGMVKLLVGPFDEASLSAARQRLQAQGIANFPR